MDNVEYLIVLDTFTPIIIMPGAWSWPEIYKTSESSSSSLTRITQNYFILAAQNYLNERVVHEHMILPLFHHSL